MGMEKESTGGDTQLQIEERLAIIAGLDQELKRLTEAENQDHESITGKTDVRNKAAAELGELTKEGKEGVQALIADYKEKKGLEN